MLHASLDGRGVWRRMDTCLCMAGSLCSSPETITTLSLGYVKWSENRSVVSDSLRSHGLYSPWNSLGQNTEVSSLSLLQGIFPTKGSKPGLLHCGQILYQLSHKGSPGILEWVAYSFSSTSSWPRTWTRVSCVAGRLFTNWAIREAQSAILQYKMKSLKKINVWWINKQGIFHNTQVA